MKTQILEDNNGLPTGVFIPIEEWKNIKNNYPNIETVNKELMSWQKDLLDSRLADITNPEKLESISALFKVLDAE